MSDNRLIWTLCSNSAVCKGMRWWVSYYLCVLLYVRLGHFPWRCLCCIYCSHLDVCTWKESLSLTLLHLSSCLLLWLHGPAGRKQPRWDRHLLCWNEWLSRKQSVAIRLLKEEEETFISQVQSGFSACKHLMPGCVRSCLLLMCRGGVFSWLYVHTGNT